MMKNQIRVNKNYNGRNIWEVVRDYYGEREINVLEIGVYKATQIKYAKKILNINNYVGIDPYMGTENDSYLGAYWKGEIDAFNVYKEAKEVFENLGGILYKTTSDTYYHSRPNEVTYDVIMVDGDHRYKAALTDIINFWELLKVGGIMIIDDYANVDVPDVTKAINDFLGLADECIDRIDESSYWFRNTGKRIPVVNKKIFLWKKSDIQILNNKTNRKLYLWGRGKVANEYLSKWEGNVEIEGVLDSHGSMDGFCGIPSVAISDVIASNGYIIVGTTAFYEEIKRILEENGMTETQDFLSAKLYDDFILPRKDGF